MDVLRAVRLQALANGSITRFNQQVARTTAVKAVLFTSWSISAVSLFIDLMAFGGYSILVDGSLGIVAAGSLTSFGLQSIKIESIGRFTLPSNKRIPLVTAKEAQTLVATLDSSTSEEYAATILIAASINKSLE